jgi:hypothetical protein
MAQNRQSSQGAQGSQGPQGTASGSKTQQQHGQPKRTDLFFHLFKSSKLMGALIKDRRVSVLRKVAYLGIVGFLLAALLFPELFGDVLTALTPLLPLDILGIPTEGVFDWAAFAVATFELLRLFPKEVVGEHYDRLFRR